MPVKNSKPKEEKKYYYHITNFEGWNEIIDGGLKASGDGYIYMLDTEDYVYA